MILFFNIKRDIKLDITDIKMDYIPKFTPLLATTIFVAIAAVALGIYTNQLTIGESIISLVLLLILTCIARATALIDSLKVTPIQTPIEFKIKNPIKVDKAPTGSSNSGEKPYQNENDCPACFKYVTETISMNDGGSKLCNNCGKWFHKCRKDGIMKIGTFGECGCN